MLIAAAVVVSNVGCDQMTPVCSYFFCDIKTSHMRMSGIKTDAEVVCSCSFDYCQKLAASGYLVTVFHVFKCKLAVTPIKERQEFSKVCGIVINASLYRMYDNCPDAERYGVFDCPFD